MFKNKKLLPDHFLNGFKHQIKYPASTFLFPNKHILDLKKGCETSKQPWAKDPLGWNQWRPNACDLHQVKPQAAQTLSSHHCTVHPSCRSSLLHCMPSGPMVMLRCTAHPPVPTPLGVGTDSKSQRRTESLEILAAELLLQPE